MRSLRAYTLLLSLALGIALAFPPLLALAEGPQEETPVGCEEPQEVAPVPSGCPGQSAQAGRCQRTPACGGGRYEPAAEAIGAPAETPAPILLGLPGLARANPLPLGSTLMVEGSEGKLAIRVLRTNSDAFPQLQRYSRFNLPPQPGYKQILVRVQITNLTPGRTVTVYRGDFRLLGSSPRLISPLSSQVKDRLFADLSYGRIAEGEIPFEVRQDDEDLVLIYDADYAGTQRYYFALK